MATITQEDIQKWSKDLDKDGFLKLENILSESEVDLYANFYEDVINGKLKEKIKSHRHDLGSHVERKHESVENITQVCWPSMFLERYTSITLENSPLHVKTLQISKELLGPDMEFDYDMLITKEGNNETETPWHSDESYWLNLADRRSLSFWFPMRDVGVEDGCMWFVPGSHKHPMRPHRPVKEGQHVLMTDECSNDEGVPQPLKRGGCTVHTGRVLHYTAGNTTNLPRRAYIVNYRPKTMIEFERANNYDHGKGGIGDLAQGLERSMTATILRD